MGETLLNKILQKTDMFVSHFSKFKHYKHYNTLDSHNILDMATQVKRDPVNQLHMTVSNIVYYYVNDV